LWAERYKFPAQQQALPLYETMRKTFSIFLLTCIVTSAYSQDKLSTYKIIIDKEVSAYFNPSLINKIECQRISFVMPDKRRLLIRNYDAFKDDTINFSKAQFTYSFFSDVINDFFTFNISVDKNKSIIADTALFAEIPKCIAQNLECNFVKRDSAIKIAIADSIEYPNNLETKFQKWNNSYKYYWFVTGNPKEVSVAKTPKIHTKAISIKQQKIINAITGKIISLEEYKKNN
jgi:hypothetical protein